MRAIVSDQSADFGAQPIGTGPEFTVIAALELPPGNWVAFATVALAANGAPGTSSVQAVFLLGGEIYSPAVQSDFVISDTFEGFRVIPLTTGLAVHTRQILQVGCRASHPDAILSQPTTITAIQVDSVTRIQDQAPGFP
ncbi:MAG: hypothetical protein JO037_25305 [Actinobacteria bacterium]|nr:hypothetical protein [Actinomycetota bacterium]